MLRERMVVGDCYILQERAGEDSLTEWWIATAMFSATRFLLRFFKPGVLSPESLDAIKREALASYNIKNQFICDVIELETFSDRVYLSYEYHGEISVGRFLEIGESLSLTDICRHAVSFAQGLASFHESNAAFGNLNEENAIMEKTDGEWFAKIRKPAMLSLVLRSDSPVSPLRCYVAPECLAGERPVPSSDIYSLGIHVVRMVTGRLPCSGGASAPLRYVTNSLFRRGVPESLVRIILRTLLRDPDLRYQSCAEFAHDMRVFLAEPDESPQKQNAPSNPRDQAVQSRYIPSFDSNAYFRDSTAEKKGDAESVYPVMRPEGVTDVDDLEREELVVTPEESAWSIDDYIANARRVVSGIATETRKIDGEAFRDVLGLASGEGKPAVEDSRPIPVLETAPDAPTPRIEDAFPSIVLPTPGGAEDMTIPQVSPAIEHRPRKPRKKASRRKSDSRIVGKDQERKWNYQRVPLQDVLGIVEGAARRASAGFGSFRYVQEPESGYRNSSLFSALESLAKANLYINAGSCARYGSASIDDFLEMFAKSLAERLRDESKKATRAIARAVSVKDSHRAFRREPLGAVLYGANGRVGKRGVVSDSEYAVSVARALVAFGRPKRPLVVVLRGGEKISRELHDFFSLLAREMSGSPVVFVVFFDRIRFESWHTLSLLENGGRTSKDGT